MGRGSERMLSGHAVRVARTSAGHAGPGRFAGLSVSRETNSGATGRARQAGIRDTCLNVCHGEFALLLSASGHHARRRAIVGVTAVLGVTVGWATRSTGTVFIGGVLPCQSLGNVSLFIDLLTHLAHFHAGDQFFQGVFLDRADCPATGHYAGRDHAVGHDTDRAFPAVPAKFGHLRLALSFLGTTTEGTDLVDADVGRTEFADEVDRVLRMLFLADAGDHTDANRDVGVQHGLQTSDGFGMAARQVSDVVVLLVVMAVDGDGHRHTIFLKATNEIVVDQGGVGEHFQIGDTTQMSVFDQTFQFRDEGRLAADELEARALEIGHRIDDAHPVFGIHAGAERVFGTAVGVAVVTLLIATEGQFQPGEGKLGRVLENRHSQVVRAFHSYTILSSFVEFCRVVKRAFVEKIIV